MDNPEKLATLGTQDEDKQNKKRHHYMQTNTNNVNNWRKRRTEYRFHAEIVTDITTWN